LKLSLRAGKHLEEENVWDTAYACLKHTRIEGDGRKRKSLRV
jgi:hypothetical protein